MKRVTILFRIPAKKELPSMRPIKINCIPGLVRGRSGLEKKEEDQKRISELVRKYKDHPSLLIWEISDEPAFTWKSPDYRVSPETMLESYQVDKTRRSASSYLYESWTGKFDLNLKKV